MTKKNHEQRNVYFHFAQACISGTQKIKGQNFGVSTTFTKKKGESIRAFPLSNWTEMDIWQYIYKEQILIIPLYFAAERPVVERDGTLIMLDDDRLQLLSGESIKMKKVRFRSLGCYPLTAAITSDADNLELILLELLKSRNSEREGRTIDKIAMLPWKEKGRGLFLMIFT